MCPLAAPTTWAVLKQLMEVARSLYQSWQLAVHFYLPQAAHLLTHIQLHYFPWNLTRFCFPWLFPLSLTLHTCLGTSDAAISSHTPFVLCWIRPYSPEAEKCVSETLSAWWTVQIPPEFWQWVCTPKCTGQESYMFCLYLHSVASMTSAPFNPLASLSTVMCRCY